MNKNGWEQYKLLKKDIKNKAIKIFISGICSFKVFVQSSPSGTTQNLKSQSQIKKNIYNRYKIYLLQPKSPDLQFIKYHSSKKSMQYHLLHTFSPLSYKRGKNSPKYKRKW